MFWAPDIVLKYVHCKGKKRECTAKLCSCVSGCLSCDDMCSCMNCQNCVNALSNEEVCDDDMDDDVDSWCTRLKSTHIRRIVFSQMQMLLILIWTVWNTASVLIRTVHYYYIGLFTNNFTSRPKLVDCHDASVGRVYFFILTAAYRTII